MKLAIECVFESFAQWQDAREAGDAEGMAKAAAEADRYPKAAVGDPLLKQLAVALLATRKYVTATKMVHHSLYDSDSLPNPDYALMTAALAEAVKQGLLPPDSL